MTCGRQFTASPLLSKLALGSHMRQPDSGHMQRLAAAGLWRTVFPHRRFWCWRDRAADASAAAISASVRHGTALLEA